jgi:hypothetical protein
VNKEAVVVDDTHPNIPFANTDEFYHQTGLFYFAWTRTDLVIDWAFWKALKTVTPEQAHERVAGLTFGRKCAEFRTFLLDSKEFEHIEKVKALLARITNDSMRNVFAHSFLASDEGSVTFIHRRKEDRQYRVDWHTFKRAEFLNHVREFIQLSFDFQRAVGVSDWDLARFAAAARPSKSTTPSAPNDDKNPAPPAVKRKAEEDWGKRWS